MLRITSYTVVALTLAACAVEDDLETETQQAIYANCDIWGCGENSPNLGPFVDWWELHSKGLPNNVGLRVEGFFFTPGGTRYQPLVSGDRLYAIHPNGSRLYGLALQQGYFLIRGPAPGNQEYRLKISKVNPKATSNVTFWVGPATPIETYELTYTTPSSTQIQRVCANPPNRDSGEGPGHIWQAPLEAVLLSGDRYVKPTGGHLQVVTGTATQDYFTIGCPGSVAAKMHFNRQTEAGATAGYYALPLLRQSMLMMYVSDVCGTGKSWTEAGTPIHFQQLGNFSHLVGDEFAFESQWGPDGALCMDTHRLGTTNLMGIQAMCSIPACGGSVISPTFWTGSNVVSAVPFDPNP